MANPKKKQKRRANDSIGSSSSRLTLTCLPLELLGEILLYTCSPPTVLAVSRTCSYLYRTLVLNPTASFIWRGVRTTCKPKPLPDPTGAWKGTEAEYAAFIFSRGLCEVCKKELKSMYVSFAARIRLCYGYSCRKKFLSQHLIDVASITQAIGHPIWLPSIESTRCITPNSYIHSDWPELGTVMLRKSEWEKYRGEWELYVAAEAKMLPETQILNIVGERSNPSPAQIRDSLLKIYHAKMARYKEIMSFSVQLLNWKYAYERAVKDMRAFNNNWAKSLASREGWNVADLLSSPAYSALNGRLTYLMVAMTEELFKPIRPIVESQLLTVKEHRERSLAEEAYRKRLKDVKSLYESMKSKGTMAIPPLSVFLKLPAVRAIRGRPDPGETSKDKDKSLANLNDNALVASLIKSDIFVWVDSVRMTLLKELGFPDGWKSASTNKFDPLYRPTARFLCTRCPNGGVSKKTERQGCLDFFDVCAHVCRITKRNATTPVQQKKDEDDAQEEASDVDMADEVDEEAKVATTHKRRNKRSSELDWRVDVFKRDDKACIPFHREFSLTPKIPWVPFLQAIALVNLVLSTYGLPAERLDAILFAGNMTRLMVCMSCEGWVVMDFQGAIGHCHRHESMQIESIPTSGDPLGFESGLASHLLNPKPLTRKIINESTFGCRHCVKVVRGEQPSKGKPMTANGLRSHLKAK
ncbi:hypothetical protein V8B97DRAFT_1870582 [Scleroderma yunnanense]